MDNLLESSEKASYYSIPDAVVYEIGRLAIVAGRLESQVHAVATALALTPGKAKLSDLTKDISKSVVARGVPPWSTIESSVIMAWCGRVRDEMGKRNETIHSSIHHRYQNGQLEPVRTHIQSGVTQDLPEHNLIMSRQALEKLYSDGLEIWRFLLPQMREGVYVKVYPADAIPTGVVMPEDGKEYAGRPTGAEIDEFVKTLPQWKIATQVV